MSLIRMVYYSAVIGGWAALLAWSAAELIVFRTGMITGSFGIGLTGGLVGGAIGAGVCIVGGIANGQWKEIVLRVMPGMLAGGIGGSCGGILGDWLFSGMAWPRAFGWMVMGMSIGTADGIYERSRTKIRNGFIGGAVGGLIGGFLFDPILDWVHSGTGMSSRATAFVILGLCIGGLIGLVQVVLKEAWLTVLDGYRSGRQLILSHPVTVLGRAEHIALPFLGSMDKDLEPEHLQVCRQPNGSFTLEDKHSRLGTRINGQVVQGLHVLRNGDLIKFGTNIVRFNERRRGFRDPQSASSPALGAVQLAAPPPPPVVRSSTSRPTVTGSDAKPQPWSLPAPSPALTHGRPGTATSKPARQETQRGGLLDQARPAISIPPPPPPPQKRAPK